MIRRLLSLPLDLTAAVIVALLPNDPLGLGDSFGKTVDVHPVFSSNDELDQDIVKRSRSRGDCTTSGVGWPE